MFIYALTRETNEVFFHFIEMRATVLACVICGSFFLAVFSAPSISGGATSFPTNTHRFAAEAPIICHLATGSLYVLRSADVTSDE